MDAIVIENILAKCLSDLISGVSTDDIGSHFPILCYANFRNLNFILPKMKKYPQEYFTRGMMRKPQWRNDEEASMEE